MPDINVNNPTFFQHNGQRYSFHFTKCVSGNYKYVLIGSFVGSAPPGLHTDAQYCLKVFDPISDPASISYSQEREAYDLLDFQGEHLRTVLCRSDAANTVLEKLRSKQRWYTPISDCMTVEPCYASLSDYFSHCSRYPVLTRLDIVLQFALGSRELSKISICDRYFVAHRDLKWQNGGIDTGVSGLRVRLLDFATSHLENSKLTAFRTRSARAGTLSAGISPENTSPESILGTSVNERTDVYALGMLLASLFITVEKRYQNPNQLWLSNAGWNDSNYLKYIGSAIDHCQKRYDSDSEDSLTWIEKSLKQDYNITTHWESLPDAILWKIRKLFYSATRIEADRRCSRDAFIRALGEIIEEAKLADPKASAAKEPQASSDPLPTKQPVCVFLFNRANSAQYKASYQAAAKKALQELTEGDIPAQHVLCVSYGSLEHGTFNQEVLPLSEVPINAGRLETCIEQLTQAENSTTDHMLYGLYKAYQLLQPLRSRFYFDGQVFLFTPQVPDDRVIEPFLKQVDRPALLRTIEENLDCENISIHAFTVIEPDEDSWCTEYTLLHGDPKPEPKQEAAPTPSEETLTFQTDKNASYIKLPNRQKAYCGIVKK